MSPNTRTLLPTTNADGIPVIPMTDEQKYIFDLKGWLLLSSLLSEEQLEAIREHQMKFLYESHSLPANQRNNHGGPSQLLLDHPAIVGVLNEVVSYQRVASEDCYGFRFDHSFTTHRKFGHDNFHPHGGGGLFSFNGNSHVYQAQPGRVHAGLTRVVWELNAVQHGRGGTLLLSGSHKTAFPRPPSLSGRDSKLFETYECPGGSALIFTESLCHSGSTWSNPSNDRLAIFTCYNTIGSRWGGAASGGNVPFKVIDSMPAKRKTLFRGVWTGGPKSGRINTYFDPTNQAASG